MTATFKEVFDIFESGRKAMNENNRDLLMLSVLLEGEFDEFLTAMLDYLTDPTQETAQEFAQEAADLGIYLEQILRMVGSNLLVEMIDKTVYNITRFHAGEFSRQDYDTAYKKAKQTTKAIGWKQTYQEVEHVKYDHTTALNMHKKLPVFVPEMKRLQAFTPITIFDSRKRQPFLPVQIDQQAIAE